MNGLESDNASSSVVSGGEAAAAADDDVYFTCAIRMKYFAGAKIGAVKIE